MELETKNQNNLVSVIINCFNSEAFITRAIDSVISQSYINWEIILWDNQSTDLTRELVDHFQENRIKYFLAPTFTTLSQARKLAIEKAKGEYLAFLDSDDYWDSQKLQAQITILENYLEVGIVHTHFKLVTENSEISTILQNNYYATIKQKSYSNKKIYRELLYSNFIIFSSVIIRRQIYEAIGGINEMFNQNEDYELLLKASLITKASNISPEMTFYRIHSNNQSHKNRELSFIENKIIFKSLDEKFFSFFAYHRNQFRYHIFLYKSQHKSLSFVMNPINWYFTLEYLIRRIFK
jgi:glycosyltransferase involved in cell wall biosynthesis